MEWLCCIPVVLILIYFFLMIRALDQEGDPELDH